MYDNFMKNAILLATNQDFVSQNYEKSYFSTKYRISAQNRIHPCRINFTNSTALLALGHPQSRIQQ